MKLQPLYEHVLLRRCEADPVSKGGIIIPDNAKEAPVQGEVLAVGSGRLLDNGSRAGIPLQRGQRVLFGKYAGVDIVIDGEKYVMVKDDDILGVFG